jgi:hypothetical protein
MIPIIEDSSAPNGFGTIGISNPNPSISTSSTIKTITTAALKAKPHYGSSKKQASHLPGFPENSPSPSSITFRTERSPLSASSAVTENWISLENILNFLNPSSTLMSELKSSPVCIRSKSIPVMPWLKLFLTVYRHGLLQILKTGKRCIGTS